VCYSYRVSVQLTTSDQRLALALLEFRVANRAQIRAQKVSSIMANTNIARADNAPVVQRDIDIAKQAQLVFAVRSSGYAPITRQQIANMRFRISKSQRAFVAKHRAELNVVSLGNKRSETSDSVNALLDSLNSTYSGGSRKKTATMLIIWLANVVCLTARATIASVRKLQTQLASSTSEHTRHCGACARLSHTAKQWVRTRTARNTRTRTRA
jgi:hypothetical protein